MSRSLPSHPSLEHLKKQAKDLLDDLKKQDPALKLADAQHALAREYGFASWPKLKAHVESLQHFEATSPFIGKWIANISKSKQHAANPFQSATIHFTVDRNSVTITDAVIDESGREVTTTNTILVDGNEHASDNGYVFVATWNGSHVLETVAKKDGQVVGWGKYEVSEDDKSLTIFGDEQRIVLDRG